MSNNSNNSLSGLGLGMILFLIFMTLKLTGNITWSWWYVTLPLWGPLLLVLVILGIAALVAYNKLKR
jgi:ABC-type antimicrobial peptide transport system permease subunit